MDNTGGNTVTLTPKTPFTLAKPVQLLVTGTGATGLEDTDGRLIDGDHDGQPGGNAVAILTKKGITIDAVELTRADGPRVAIAGAKTERIGGPFEVVRSLARTARPVNSERHLPQGKYLPSR